MRESREGFTIGQRKGLGIALGEPHFVVRIKPDTRRVVIGRYDELARQELTGRAAPTGSSIRRRSRGAARENPVQRSTGSGSLPVLPDDRLHVEFDEPRRGVHAGQAVVVYDDDRVLGGGWIESQ